jgi:hypothetical protein
LGESVQNNFGKEVRALNPSRLLPSLANMHAGSLL